MYAPTDGQPAVPVDGRRKLFSGLIIAADTLDTACNTSLPIQFSHDKWGVIIENFNEIIAVLESDSLLRRSPSDDYEATYHLTYNGTCTAAELYTELSQDEQTVLEWTRSQHMTQPSGTLLSFVYRQYIASDTPLLP